MRVFRVCKPVFMSILLIVLAGACSSTSTPRYEPPDEPVDRSSVFRSRWQAYRDRATQAELQPDCVPRIIEPASGARYRGTVVMLHGFSACPQQFFEIADLLAVQGYRSVLPLLPGHGRIAPASDRDDTRDLPVGATWKQRYTDFAAQINGLMEYADGDRVIAGLSAGASAALYLDMQARDLYDRVLVIAPFLATGGGAMANATAATTARVPLVRSASVKPFGLKAPCLEKRARGRAGFCNYQLKHVGALTAMGGDLYTGLIREPLDVRLQLVGTESDTVVSNARIRDLLQAQSGTGKTTACFFPAGVPHAMVSVVDNPDADMYWLDAVESGVVGFVTAGTPFPTNGRPSSVDPAIEQCRVEIEADE